MSELSQAQTMAVPASGRLDRGFSLLEMLVVLAIMGLLAALVAPRLFNQVDKSKLTVAETQARSLMTALETLKLDIGRYPTSEEGLSLLVSRPQDAVAARQWMGPYMDEGVPVDPWGNPYAYAPAGIDESGFQQKPFVYSLGADNAPGGAGMNKDIGRLPEPG